MKRNVYVYFIFHSYNVYSKNKKQRPKLKYFLFMDIHGIQSSKLISNRIRNRSI
jgi:hypothetical protein